jgi:hypothetical protein
MELDIRDVKNCVHQQIEHLKNCFEDFIESLKNRRDEARSVKLYGQGPWKRKNCVFERKEKIEECQKKAKSRKNKGKEFSSSESESESCDSEESDTEESVGC